MLDTENMQIVSRLLAIALERWCSHRAAKTKQSTAAAKGLSQGGGAARLAPLVRIGYQQFRLHNILPAQALEKWALALYFSRWSSVKKCLH